MERVVGAGVTGALPLRALLNAIVVNERARYSVREIGHRRCLMVIRREQEGYMREGSI